MYQITDYRNCNADTVRIFWLFSGFIEVSDKYAQITDSSDNSMIHKHRQDFAMGIGQPLIAKIKPQFSLL